MVSMTTTTQTLSLPRVRNGALVIALMKSAASGAFGTQGDTNAGSASGEARSG